MNEAKDRDEMLKGYLTKREQVVLGMLLIQARGKQSEKTEGQRDARSRKVSIMRQLGLGWVADRVNDRSEDPEAPNQPMFVKTEMNSEKAAFTLSRADVAWLLDRLDNAATGGPGDFVLAEIEERLVDLKAGLFRMPAELLEAAPLNGTAPQQPHA
jgi:hypothetical protein